MPTILAISSNQDFNLLAELVVGVPNALEIGSGGKCDSPKCMWPKVHDLLDGTTQVNSRQTGETKNVSREAIIIKILPVNVNVRICEYMWRICRQMHGCFRLKKIAKRQLREVPAHYCGDCHIV